MIKSKYKEEIKREAVCPACGQAGGFSVKRKEARKVSEESERTRRVSPTETIRLNVEGSDTIGDLIDYFNENEGVVEHPEEYFRRLRDSRGLSNAAFVRLCHLSPRWAPRVEQWCSGEATPGTRMVYLKIILGFGMSADEANRLLTRVGCYGRLYAKNIDDAIVLYLLQTGQGYDRFVEIKKRVSDELMQCIGPYRERALEKLREKQPGTEPEEEEVNRLAMRVCTSELIEQMESGERRAEPTDIILSRLSTAQSEEELLEFVRASWCDIYAQHWRVLRFIDDMIAASAELRCGVLRGAEEAVKTEHNLYAVLTQCVAYDCINSQTKSLLMADVSRLRNLGELPGRNTLIVLGVLMGSGLDSVNRLLGVAGMEPLCVRRGIEAAIYHSLTHQGGQLSIQLLRDDMSDFNLERPSEEGERMLDMFMEDGEEDLAEVSHE